MADQSCDGKGRVNEWDDVQSMQSLSLSDCHGYTVPRSTLSESSGNFAHAPYYTDSDKYLFETNGFEQAYYVDTLSRSPGTLPGIAHSGGSAAFTNSRDLAHGDSNWDTVSHHSASTDATAQGSMFSLSSRSSSGASSAPSQGSNVDTHINMQAPPRQRYQLPCEFRSRGCNQSFNGDEEREWIEHTEGHLGGSFPSKLKCWFCEDFGPFDAKARGWDNRYNFEVRMQHIRGHILEGERPQDIRPDGLLINFLKKQGLIDEQGYQGMLRPARPLPAAAPGGSHHHHHHHHHRHQHWSSHRRLPPVVEEAGPSSSSGSRDRRGLTRGSTRATGRSKTK